MNTLAKLTNTHANTPEAWKPLAKVAALVVALLLSAATSNAFTLIKLTGDVGQTTPDNYNPTALALAATTNDTFAYNPVTPTTPLPVRTYSTSPNGYHGPNQPSVTVAYTFDNVVGGDLFFDLYGRSDIGAQYRDNGLVLRLYNGDWVTPVHTSLPFDINDNAPYHTRYTALGVIFADRMSINRTATIPDNYFTLMEIRGVVPEPSVVALLGLGGLLLIKRRAA